MFSSKLANLMFEESTSTDQWSWIWQIVDAIKTVLWPILIVVCAAGMIYGIVLGINMARADSTEKREEAKKRLINVVVGVAIIIALILFFELCINWIFPALIPGWTTPSQS